MPKPNRKVPATIKVNLLDQRFGQWTVVGFAGRSATRGIVWDCRCSCGRISKVAAGNLRSGATTKCFRCSRAMQAKKKLDPGLRDSAIYKAWHAAKREGACKAWQDLATFLYDTSPKPPRAKLTRRDQSKPHSPGNSYWRTPKHTIQRQIDELIAFARPATEAAEERLREHLANHSRAFRHVLLQRARRGEPIFRRKSLAEQFGIET